MANTSSTPTVAAVAPSLFDVLEPRLDPRFGGATRTDLGWGAWLEVVPGWLQGSTAVFDDLVANLPWRGHQVHMYGELLDQPRLSAWGRGIFDEAHLARPVVDEARRLLDARYGVELGSIGCNLYRDGADSVAWHGDRILRDRPADAIVVVLSLGGRRPFRLRPKVGGAGLGLAPASGDLLVMGGSCQRTWQHSVPKVRHALPRVSVTFRHGYPADEP